MRFKLDENLGRLRATALLAGGHDISSVAEQGLSGATDRALIEVCRKERRCLISLDVEFANPLVFPPHGSPGIVVLRVRQRAAAGDLRFAMASLARALSHASPEGRLWVVQHDRVREYQDPSVE